MKKLLMISIGLLFIQAAQAQTDERKWNIGFYGGLTQYNGDRGQNFYNYAAPQAAYGFAAVSASRYLSRHFDANLFLTYGEVGNMQPMSPWSTPVDEATRHFKARMSTLSLMMRYNFTGPESTLRPYLFAGPGIIVTDKKGTVLKKRVDFAAPTMGLGLTVQMGDIVALQIQEAFMYTTADDIDRTIGGYNDGYLFHTIGLTFNLGKSPDADMDGVSDKKDQCSGTPAGVMVDVNGCPVDRDKDGVADYIDQCPDLAGLSALQGCPDRDSDGIADKDDRCPETAGPAKFSGCPDSDNDGVIDLVDKCPGTKAGYAVDTTGCTMDKDKDGIVNEDDRCPDLAGSLAMNGCPDTDGDGVSDLDDRCPKVMGTIANKGCPEMAKEDVKKITQIASKIYFETGSAKLKKESLAQLDALVLILQKYEAAYLVIEGHTDDVGEDAYNMDLSQRRTESVKAYLASKGIFESRLTAIGYGETRPIDDNKKASGRAKNRRVELKTSY